MKMGDNVPYFMDNIPYDIHLGTCPGTFCRDDLTRAGRSAVPGQTVPGPDGFEGFQFLGSQSYFNRICIWLQNCIDCINIPSGGKPRQRFERF